MQAPGMITLQITLTDDQITEALIQAGIMRVYSGPDRYSAMVDKYGEACTKTTATKILSCSATHIRDMIADGRIKAACGGERVDVRSIADYIERKPEEDNAAKARRKARKRRA